MLDLLNLPDDELLVEMGNRTRKGMLSDADVFKKALYQIQQWPEEETRHMLMGLFRNNLPEETNKQFIDIIMGKIDEQMRAGDNSICICLNSNKVVEVLAKMHSVKDYTLNSVISYKHFFAFENLVEHVIKSYHLDRLKKIIQFHKEKVGKSGIFFLYMLIFKYSSVSTLKHALKARVTEIPDIIDSILLCGLEYRHESSIPYYVGSIYYHLYEHRRDLEYDVMRILKRVFDNGGSITTEDIYSKVTPDLDSAYATKHIESLYYQLDAYFSVVGDEDAENAFNDLMEF